MNSVKEQSGKWSIMPLPAFTPGGNIESDLGGSILAITKQSKNQEAAWKFLEYSLATQEGETVMLDYGLFPSYTPIYTTDVFKKNFDYFGMPIYTFFADHGKNIPEFHYGPIMLDAGKPINDMNDAVFNGQNVLKAAETAQQQIAKIAGLSNQ